MTTVRVVGLDLSMTSTGIARPDGSTFTVGGPAIMGDRRLLAIVDAVTETSRDVDLVVLEDLPVNAKSAGITGMVQGAVRVTLLNAGVPYALVSPATVKKFATGRGNADKTAMTLAAFKRAGLEFQDSDRCDAWWLRAAGMQFLGSPVVDLPKQQVAALLSARWPKIDRLSK